MQAGVAALKKQFEHLFPGKWLSADSCSQTLSTGIAEIDRSLLKGIVRQRITEWIGSQSSGKTSLLRVCVANWCAAGFSVAYIDVEKKLRASDWAFVEEGYCAATPLNTVPAAVASNAKPGRFWVIRPGDGTQASWCADQLIRSSTFDVVILDLGGSAPQSSKQADRVYARFQRSLTQAKTALLILRDSKSDSAWESDTFLSFSWRDTLRYDAGIAGISKILPSVTCLIRKDGISKTQEVNLNSHVSNCLFTHPQVPDRRTPKARA